LDGLQHASDHEQLRQAADSLATYGSIVVRAIAWTCEHTGKERLRHCIHARSEFALRARKHVAERSETAREWRARAMRVPTLRPRGRAMEFEQAKQSACCEVCERPALFIAHAFDRDREVRGRWVFRELDETRARARDALDQWPHSRAILDQALFAFRTPHRVIRKRDSSCGFRRCAPCDPLF
jgi:hypothetical protein